MAATSRLSSPFWGETTCIGLVQLLRKCARQAVPMRRLPHSPASSLMVISPSAPLASLPRDKALRPCLLGGHHEAWRSPHQHDRSSSESGLNSPHRSERGKSALTALSKCSKRFRQKPSDSHP